MAVLEHPETGELVEVAGAVQPHHVAEYWDDEADRLVQEEYVTDEEGRDWLVVDDGM